MLKLLRYNYSEKQTQGVFLIDGVYYGDSLERPWLDNKHDISCIPEGNYVITHGQFISHTGQSLEGYQVWDVNNRTDIWIHPAESVSQLNGCIGTGIKYGDMLYYNSKVLIEIYSKIGADGELEITSES